MSEGRFESYGPSTPALLTLWLCAFVCLNYISASNMFTHVALCTHFVSVCFFSWVASELPEWGFYVRVRDESKAIWGWKWAMSFLIWAASASRAPPPLICQHAHCVSTPLCCVCLSVHWKENREPEKEMIVIKWLWLTVIWKWNIKLGLWRGGKLSFQRKRQKMKTTTRRGGGRVETEKQRKEETEKKQKERESERERASEYTCLNCSTHERRSDTDTALSYPPWMQDE